MSAIWQADQQIHCQPWVFMQRCA